MDIGTPVVVYDHESNDGVSEARNDRLGLINGPVGEDGTAKVLIFNPPKVEEIRIAPYDPDRPYYSTNQTFYREPGTDAPDFADHFGYPHDGAWQALIAKQRVQRFDQPLTGDQVEQVEKRHMEERDALAERLAEKYPREQEAETDA